MSTRKLFIGGLAWATDDDSLAAAFTRFGDVDEARVIMDHESGRSKGFGFITMATAEAATEALNVMNDELLDGRRIRVNEAIEKERRPSDRSRENGPGGQGQPRRRPRKIDLPMPEIIRRK